MKDFPKARFGDTYASYVYVSKGYSALPPVVEGFTTLEAASVVMAARAKSPVGKLAISALFWRGDQSVRQNTPQPLRRMV